MADNLTTEDTDLSTVPSGTVIATDNIGGVNYQRVKLTWGADGTASDASSAAPIPVDLTNTGANATALKVDGSGVTQPVSGTVSAAQSGTWNIATVTTLTGITNPLPAGTNAIGKTWIGFQATKALTNASVSISSSGDNTVVSGTAAQTIRVFKLVLVAASAVSVTIKDGTAGTALTGAIPLTANGALVVESPDGEPEFITSTANNFVVNLSAAVTVTGWVQYVKS